jgi:excisionase family DNA binding protein
MANHESADPRIVVTVKEAAALLGVHEETAKRWVKRGEIPSFVLGSRRFVPKQAIKDMIVSAYEDAEKAKARRELMTSYRR